MKKSFPTLFSAVSLVVSGCAHIRISQDYRGPQKPDLSLIEYYNYPIDYYQPKIKTESPLILISPILAGDNIFAQEFAALFCQLGYCQCYCSQTKDKIPT